MLSINHISQWFHHIDVLYILSSNLCFVVVVCPIEVEIFSPILISFFFRHFANQEFFLFGIFIFFCQNLFFFSICTLYAVFITGISHIARTGYATVWGQLWNLIWRSPITPCFRNYRLTTLWLFWRWETLQFLISLIHNDLLAEV